MSATFDPSDNLAADANTDTGEGSQPTTDSRYLSPQTVMRLPWHFFYWSVLDVHDLPVRLRNGQSETSRVVLEEKFQAEVPIPLAEAAVSYSPLPNEHVLACGLPVSELDRATAAVPNLLLLLPESLPPTLKDIADLGDLRSLNLLVHEHEPRAVTHLKASKRRTSLLFAIGALAIISIGVARRASNAASQTELIQNAAQRAAAETSGMPRDLATTLPVLERERQRLTMTRTGKAETAIPQDAGKALQKLLAAWPSDLEIRTQALSSSPQGMTVAAEVSDQAAAGVLGNSLANVPNWTLQPPRTRSTGKSVRFDASLTRQQSQRPAILEPNTNPPVKASESSVLSNPPPTHSSPKGGPQ